MPRTPSQQQNAPFGSQNNAGLARAAPAPVTRNQGPAQGLEQFGAELDPKVARALNQVQQSIKAALGQVKGLPFANGNLLENVSLSVGTNILQHGLGAPWRGAFATRIGAGNLDPVLIPILATIPQDLGGSKSPGTTIYISCSIACTADIWVYQ